MRILDTDTCIEILRGNEKILERRAAVIDEVLTTWITASELHFGAALSTSPRENGVLVDEFLRATRPVDLDIKAAQRFGEIKAALQREGGSLPDANLFIAAIALARGATLVTGDTRHFERLPGIILENWIRG